jgi:hypothetical protein
VTNGPQCGAKPTQHPLKYRSRCCWPANWRRGNHGQTPHPPHMRVSRFREHTSKKMGLGRIGELANKEAPEIPLNRSPSRAGSDARFRCPLGRGPSPHAIRLALLGAWALPALPDPPAAPGGSSRLAHPTVRVGGNRHNLSARGLFALAVKPAEMCARYVAFSFRKLFGEMSCAQMTAMSTPEGAFEVTDKRAIRHRLPTMR